MRPVVDAVWSGTADPPEEREWAESRRGRWPFSRVSPRSASLAFDVLLTLIIMSTTANMLIDQVPHYSPNFLILAAAAMSIPLLLRHWHPLGAWRLSLLAMLWTSTRSWLTIPYAPGGVIVFLLISYSVAVRCERRITIGAGVVSVAVVWLIDEKTVFVAAMMALVPLLAGYNVRARRSGRRELEQREEAHREERAVLAERQRIAREMHDVVAHHMSVIAIQAEAAPYRVPDPDPVLAKSFADIRTNALAGLADLRRILGVLRDESSALLTAPQPDLDRIDDLVDNARGTGMDVTYEVTGEPSALGLPPGVGLAVYRIAQEALSNAMKHAPGARVRIALAHEPDAVRLAVTNGPATTRPRESAGPQPASTGGGHGIIGMRERATSLGGTFTATGDGEDGFTVTAAFPLDRDAEPSSPSPPETP